jgi:hypothetical protein
MRRGYTREARGSHVLHHMPVNRSGSWHGFKTVSPFCLRAQSHGPCAQELGGWGLEAP